MRVRIHHPLFAGFLGVVALLVVLVVSLVGTGLRRELVGLMRTELARELQLAEMVVASAPAGFDADSLAGALTARLGHRVTLIAADGRVLGDSDVPSSAILEVENHLERPEIQAAAAGGVGYAERASGTVGTPFLYAAVRTDDGGEVGYVRMAATLSEISATLLRSTRAVALTGLAAMALALVVAYLLSRALTRPLVVLSDRAQRLAQGDLSSRAPRSTRVHELDEVAIAFNRLADELQARLNELGRERDEMQALIDCMAEGVVALTDDARILRTNRSAREILGLPDPPLYSPVGAVVRQPELRELLEASVTRPVRAGDVALGDRSLIVSSRQLDQGGAVTTLLDVTEIRRLEKVRQDFVANASHELKTPLTAMRGFAETLLEDDPPETLRREFLTSIHNNTVRLQLLVDDLLDLSRLESGGWRAREEEVQVAEIAARVWDDLDEGGPRRELDFSLEGDGLAWADEQGVEQVMRNLLDNARRYTQDGGSVAVMISTTEPGPGESHGTVWVDVSDSGSGIPSKSLPRIFERFYRADTSRAREVGGTGLGLAIVRHLVQVMGGEVSARSELGRGTTLRFSLPRVDTPPRSS
ncbi:ATP-binding protein [Gemmatimonadota bacterium Y43]|uniref:sensor histidine kinase n=1 Tax=Gaopeijia maritima TaxID=3119007 RepID=UPI00326C5C30